jgi:hypothetical protein
VEGRVTLSDVSRGTTIYYTPDGSKPTTSSKLYMGPITVSANETITRSRSRTGLPTAL